MFFMVRRNPLCCSQSALLNAALTNTYKAGPLPSEWVVGTLARKLRRIKEIRRRNTFGYPAPVLDFCPSVGFLYVVVIALRCFLTDCTFLFAIWYTCSVNYIVFPLFHSLWIKTAQCKRNSTVTTDNNNGGSNSNTGIVAELICSLCYQGFYYCYHNNRHNQQ